MTDEALTARAVKLRRTDDGIELYFPPLRMAQVALPLAVFGLIACALAAVGGAAMASGAVATSAGFLSAVLMAGFVAPFALFGIVFVVLAVYMFFNSLHVHVDAEGIATRRRIFGVTVRRRRIARDAFGALEPEIVSRHQSIFSREPVYQLVVHEKLPTRRAVVAETLHGEALMNQVKAAIEAAIGGVGQTSG
jgi:hypothetical protein